MQDIRLAIFDWDGTLMDSVGRIVACVQGAASDCELAVPAPAQIRQIIGLSLDEAMSRLRDAQARYEANRDDRASDDAVRDACRDVLIARADLEHIRRQDRTVGDAVAGSCTGRAWRLEDGRAYHHHATDRWAALGVRSIVLDGMSCAVGEARLGD